MKLGIGLSLAHRQLVGAGSGVSLDQLAAYWTLDSDAWLDSGGNELTLTENGTVPNVAAKLSNGANFTAASPLNFLWGLPVIGYPNPTFSVHCWVRPHAINADQTLIGECTPSTGAGWRLMLQGSTSKFAISTFEPSPSEQRLVSTVTVTNETFHHVVMTVINGNAIIYVNNTATAGTVLQVDDPASDIRVGVDNDGADLSNSIIDEVAVWNRVLTADEVSALWNGGNGASVL